MWLKLFRKRILFVILFFFCLSASHNLYSIESISISVEKISIEQLLSQLDAQDSDKLTNTGYSKQYIKLFKLNLLTISLDLLSSPAQLQVDLSQLQLPQPYNKISSLNITCPEFLFTIDHLQCKRGKLSFKGLMTEKITSAELSFNYDIDNNQLQLSIDGLNIGRGKLSFEVNLEGDKWHLTFNANKLDYQFFDHYVGYYLSQAKLNDVIDKLQVSDGRLTLAGHASGVLANNDKENNKLQVLKLKGQLNQLNYEYGDDLAEQLALKFSLDLNAALNNSYNISLSIDALKGEIFQNDIYVVFNGNEQIRAKFKLMADTTLHVMRFDVLSKGIFSLQSSGLFKTSNNFTINDFKSTLKINDLSLFNQSYLNNILSGTDYEGLRVEGSLSITLESKVIQNIDKVILEGQFKAFSLSINDEVKLHHLNGKVYWNNYKQAVKPVKNSQIEWQQLILNELPLGSSQFNFISHNNYLKLIQETDIPIFDGALHLNSLEVSPIIPQDNNSLTLTVDGFIKPVSLSLLSTHFDWPLLDGTLSAVIPSTTYNEKQLTVGGALMLQVFGGVIIIKDLIIDEPIHDYAQLFANIDLNNLNLKSLTKTYNFGEINGRVEGKLKGLALSGWEPVAFDAYIRTPENDKSSHKISQRAIDNLSSLGGASGLLSRSFLSIFESFRYDKIGLSCRLKNNICHMSGVEAKANSYYIVKGGGIPRIDVMGFQHKVNWAVLTSRLKAIQLANEAVIE